MVINDYHMVMTKQKSVGVAELKAKLSEYLRAVRRGGDVVIHDRSEPIARLVPYEAADARLVVREPTRKYGTLGKVPLPRPLKLDVDIAQILIEERKSGR
jgi:prevent-host-death family protein